MYEDFGGYSWIEVAVDRRLVVVVHQCNMNVKVRSISKATVTNRASNVVHVMIFRVHHFRPGFISCLVSCVICCNVVVKIGLVNVHVDFITNRAGDSVDDTMVSLKMQGEMFVI